MQMPTLRIAVLIACDSNFGPAQKPADDPTGQGHGPLRITVPLIWFSI
jgi:hypothetical protein